MKQIALHPIFKAFDRKPTGVTLGKIGGLPFQREVLTDRQMDHHVHIVGASGFGKSVLIGHIVKDLIQRKRGIIYIDLKGDRETIEDFKSFAALQGRQKDLEVFSLTPGVSNSTFNPILEGTATQIRDRIMQSFTWSEEYYKNVSSSFLIKLLILLCEVRDLKGISFTLATILSCIKDRDLFHKIAEGVLNSSPAIKEISQDLYSFLGERDKTSALQGLSTQLESLVLSDFGAQITSLAKGINFFDSIEKEKLCFIFLDTRRYGESAKAIGRLILENLKAASSRIDSEIPRLDRKRSNVIIDEFSDLANEDFISFLDRARSSKMSVTLAHQEMADLKRISPEFAARLSGNISTVYAFLQKVPESAEYISGLAGTRTVWKTTKQIERFGFFQIESGNGSRREVEEFNIHPNKVKSLGVGTCVCIKKYPRAESYLVRVARGH